MERNVSFVYMRKWGIAILMVILFVISAISGFMVRSFINFSKTNEHEQQNVLSVEEKGEIINTNSADTVVSPNAEVVLTQYYKRCGHSRVVREIAPREIVNLNEEKVREYYEGWKLDSFTANEIKLSRDNEGICGEHYIIRESDGYISISAKNDIGEYIFKGQTDIPVMYLPEGDLEELERGIEIVGRENLNKFLENFE
ncbi:MAG: hypothetical protein IKD76_02290 [Clostridia bacterium]|nr:hypothetical protein [Clostridia bacterium]